MAAFLGMLSTFAREAHGLKELALRLNDINTRRRQEEAQVIKEAREQMQGMDLLRANCLVLCGEGWNSGVVGLAAGKLAGRAFSKATFPAQLLDEKSQLRSEEPHV